MKKTSLLLALAVSLSGVSPFLANEVQQQTKQYVEEISQQDQGNKSQSVQENSDALPETKQTPPSYNIDWSLPGMQLSDWEYEYTDRIYVTLKKYIGKPTDTVYVPANFESNPGSGFRPGTIFSGNALENSTIKNLKIINLPGYSMSFVRFMDQKPDNFIDNSPTWREWWVLKIPDNSVVKNIEFVNGNVTQDSHFGTMFNGSEVRAKNNDFVSIEGYDSDYIGLYGNVTKVDKHISGVFTDLKYVEYIDCNVIEINGLEKRINQNPLYLQANQVNCYDNSKKYHEIINHYQLNQLLDGMGIKSTTQLKLDANGGSGGVVIQQPVFFVNSLTDERRKQLYQNKHDLDACIRIAFLENPTYYPTLEGRTFLGWEKQPTIKRAVADAFNQTYLAKWSDPVPVPTVTPTQPQQPVVESKPTASVNTANRTTAITLATVVLAGCVGLITVRRFK